MEPDDIENPVTRVIVKWLGWVLLLAAFAVGLGIILSPFLIGILIGGNVAIVLGIIGMVMLFILLMVILNELPDA